MQTDAVSFSQAPEFSYKLAPPIAPNMADRIAIATCIILFQIGFAIDYELRSLLLRYVRCVLCFFKNER